MSTIANQPRNLLPIILGISAVFAVAVLTWEDLPPALMCIYICLVLLSLESSRAWHTNLTAALGSVLILVKMLLSPLPGMTFGSRISITLSILLGLWGAAALGARTVHRARRQSAQLAKARALEELAREQSDMLDKLKLASQAGDSWLWEINIKGDGIWDLNRPQGFELENLSSDEARMTFRRYVLAEDRELFWNNVEQAVQTDIDTLTFLQRIESPRDGLRHFRIKVRLMKNAEGVVTHMLGVSRDVTAHVEREKSLEQQIARESLAYGRMQVAAKAAGLWIWERSMPQMDFLWDSNRPMDYGLQNIDYPQLKDALVELIVPEDRIHMRAELQETIARHGRTHTVRYRTSSPTSALIRHRETYALIEYDDTGKPVKMTGTTRDVTNEVQTHEMIQREAEQKEALSARLSSAIEAARLHCWQLQFPGPKLVWSENAVAELGPAVAGLTLAEFEPLMQSAVPAGFIADTMRAAQQGLPSRSYRYNRMLPDGPHTFQVHHRYVYLNDGSLERIVGTSIDVTEEVRSSARLAEQKAELETLHVRMERAARSSQEGHWEIDVKTGGHWVSTSYLALLGYPTDFDLSTLERVNAITHPDDLPSGPQEAQFIHSASQRDSYVHRLRMRHANGQWRWMQANGSLERDAEGAPSIISGSIRDIHEQKIAEEKLLETQQRFTRAINGTQDGLWEADIKTHKLWLSPSYMSMLGYEATENTNWYGYDLDRIMHPDDQPEVEAKRLNAYLSGEDFEAEHRFLKRDGNWIWVRVRAKLERDAQGQPTRMSGNTTDITAARIAQAELLKASEEAHAASRAKSAFLANMSHEIRTPMNGIIGMTGLLLDTPLDQTQRDFADTIRTSADSLLNIINDILDFSKIEAGKMDIEMLEMDLCASVEDVGAVLGLQASAKNLELIINVHPDIPAKVMGDPQRIRQILLNLVGNAIKFTRQGEVIVEVSYVGTSQGTLLLHFEVSDTGIGLSEDAVAKLFQPFTQADSSTTRRFGGTGLGLSIVKRLIDMMGGQIGVKSLVGQGSTFWFTLPLGMVERTTLSAPISFSENGKRILIVDDNLTNQQVLCLQLQHLGYVTQVTSSGAAALAELRTQHARGLHFDALLADFQMPEMDGGMLGEQINADPAFVQLRMILLTSMDRQGDVQRFASMGFAAYLTKPIRARELRECLERVLSRDPSEWREQRLPLLTHSAIREQIATQRYVGRALLVDDNLVNQKVAGKLLERMGLTVTFASDGAEAVSQYELGSYDIVFMDLQMPVMDGFEATRRIRDFEAWRPRTAIIALTANAMVGQLERCLASGMDGFLSKPIEVDQLRDTVAKYCQKDSSLGASEAVTETLLTTPTDFGLVLNHSKFTAMTDGDAGFMRELAELYMQSSQLCLQELQAALSQQDRPAMSRVAHKLKGASANVHAERIRDICEYIEQNAGHLSLQVLAAQTQLLHQALVDAHGELTTLIKADQSAA